MRWRVVALFGSVATLSGAFVVGAVIHRSVVRGEFSLLAPAGVFGILGGVVLILIGRRLEGQFDPSDYVPETEDDDEEEPSGMEFDEQLSPVSEEMLADREADHPDDDED